MFFSDLMVMYVLLRYFFLNTDYYSLIGRIIGYVSLSKWLV